MNSMTETDIEKNISDFRAQLLLKMPFYGEIISRVDIAATKQVVETAGTNGRVIYYNPEYFKTLTKGQQNYVLMHELFHILLLHFKRDKSKEKEIWNVAADYVVNGLLEPLVSKRLWEYKNYGIEFDKPPSGYYLDNYEGEAVENLYKKIYADNSKNKKKKILLLLSGDYSRSFGRDLASTKLDPKDFDLIIELDEQESRQLSDSIQKLTENAEKKWSNDPSIQLIKRELNILKNEKRISWKKLLKRFLNESEYVDVSYDSPERKYIHMDLILPGEGKMTKKNELKGIWAFIDTSGSISDHEMNMFISELYRLCKQYNSKMNIGFWDTAMHEVYENVKLEDIAKCTTQYSGGTDAEAVYDYIKENNINPHVMLILTDGYFSTVPDYKIKPYRKRTIVVLSDKSNEMDDYLGKVAKFED